MPTFMPLQALLIFILSLLYFHLSLLYFRMKSERKPMLKARTSLHFTSLEEDNISQHPVTFVQTTLNERNCYNHSRQSKTGGLYPKHANEVTGIIRLLATKTKTVGRNYKPRFQYMTLRKRSVKNLTSLGLITFTSTFVASEPEDTVFIN